MQMPEKLTRSCSKTLKVPMGVLFLIGCALIVQAPGEAGKVDFNRQIRPVLSENCIACHGPDEKAREAGLRLDTFGGATADNDGVRAVVPGNPEESALVKRIFQDCRERRP